MELKSAVWSKALKASADPQRGRHYLELLAATSAGGVLRGFSAERARILLSLLSGSKALSETMIAHPEWLDLLEPEALKFSRRKQGLSLEVNDWLKPLISAQDYSAAL